MTTTKGAAASQDVVAPFIKIDTRQQAGKHKNIDQWLESNGIAYSYEKLDFGDYMTDGSNISVDTKSGMDELAMDLGRDHDRFVRECERAIHTGYRLVVLVEAGPRYNHKAEVESWSGRGCKSCRETCDPNDYAHKCSRPHRPMVGRKLLATMQSMERRHAVRFIFCSKRETAKIICDLLGVEVRRIK